MNLDLPTPSTTAGPEWAQELNDALELVDEHDHSSGRGVRITPAAININADLDCNAYAVTEVDSIQLEDRGSDISARGVYAKSGNLFYRNTNGDSIQLTSGSSIAGASGSFTGLSSPAAATYSSGNKQFIWTFDSNKFARMANADIVLYPYDASTAYTRAITLKAPAGLEAASSYSITLPTALPGAVQWLNIDASGIVDHSSLAGTANQVNVSQSATAVTLSLPQDIATTSSPTFATPIVTRLTVGAGTLGLPSIHFNGDTDTGIYNSLANVLNIVTGGTSRVSVSATTLISTIPYSGTSGGFSTTLAVTGATTLSSTLAVTGATTLAALSATTGAFSSTLSVAGATGLAALTATTGAFSGALTAATVAGNTGTFASGMSAGGSSISELTVTSFLAVTGATTLGSGNTGIFVKVLSGTTSPSEGGFTLVAHGLTSSKIVSIGAVVFYSASAGIVSGYEASTGFKYAVGFDTTNVAVLNDATASESILSKPFKVTVTYTA